MTQKEIVERMERNVKMLKRGLISIGECEAEMTKAIADGLIEEQWSTQMEMDENFRVMRKMKRRMWRMLLEATK